jgi:hypothetical protein
LKRGRTGLRGTFSAISVAGQKRRRILPLEKPQQRRLEPAAGEAEHRDHLQREVRGHASKHNKAAYQPE